MDHRFALTHPDKIKPVLTENKLKVVALHLQPGESLEKHHASRLLLLQCLEGKPKFVLYPARGDSHPPEEFRLEPLTLFRVEAEREHAVYADEGECRLALWLVEE
ncbi:hypothetical protein [Paenibacillus sp. R14(2021)]|uniref:hypothetical protein n=1 Tax=Paenibacillus sp. R14(2021) TaxID=2859228 RepID=UPI001C614CE3|nr:hypothetical protein [Paenibacillus sp. R14(2021)]